ncbi:MAG: EmrB/QacA family drug resistance transporter, partial [Xanthomonas perforans]|nr:EmrB/QacA family drug resistance transporter [Xanthomonas perforans]
GLKHEKGDWAGLLNADWLGIYGLTAGLGGLTVVLEEGQRERWFESSEINTLSLIALSGFIALVIGQFRKRPPVIHLSLLLHR